MPLAVIAAGIGKGTSVVERGAFKVGTVAAKTGMNTTKETDKQTEKNITKSAANKVHEQKRLLQQGQRQSQRARARRSRELGTGDVPMVGEPDRESIPIRTEAALSPSQSPIRREQNGIQMSPATSRQRSVQIPGSTPEPAPTQTATPGEITEEENKKRETRETIIEYYLQTGNLILTAIELSTMGAGILVTWVPHMLILTRWNTQMIIGDIIWNGKHKYIGGLKYRGGWSILKHLDSSTVGLKALVIMMDLGLVLMTLVAFTFTFLIIVAMLNPLMIASYFFGSLFGPT